MRRPIQQVSARRKCTRAPCSIFPLFLVRAGAGRRSYIHGRSICSIFLLEDGCARCVSVSACILKSVNQPILFLYFFRGSRAHVACRETKNRTNSLLNFNSPLSLSLSPFFFFCGSVLVLGLLARVPLNLIVVAHDVVSSHGDRIGGGGAGDGQGDRRGVPRPDELR
jgi:hypothetical protein